MPSRQLPPDDLDLSDDQDVAVIPPDLERRTSNYRRDHRLAELVAEMAARKVESLKLYKPLPTFEPIHRSMAAERLARGGNRSGKTVGSAVEVSRAACGCDPYDKYPKRDGIIIAVGKDERHLGRVMWKYLGRSGAFKIIKDQVRGIWRTYDPRNASDAGRDDWEYAPPLIPERMIAGRISWIKKSEGIPRLVRLLTGWEIQFYTSQGDPPQGIQGDLAWIDEEIVNPLWYSELAARLLDRGGKLLWSATPQAAGIDLYELHNRARAEDPANPNPKAIEVCLITDHNPHLTDQAKADFAAKLSDDERRVRIFGEFALAGQLVYPEYQSGLHSCEVFPIPAHWTKYMIVDPGRQRCALLFVAVPPPEEGAFVYFYDEAYIKNCDAELFAAEAALRIEGADMEAFFIDHHAGSVREMGSGRTVEDQYTDELRKKGVKSARTGSGFTWASDDVQAGIQAFRSWLRIRKDGTCKLRVMEGRLKNFVWEIKNYRYKVDPRTKQPTDTPDKRNDHLMDDARYAAAAEVHWVKPRPKPKGASAVVLALKKKRAKAREKSGPAFVNLGSTRE